MVSCRAEEGLPFVPVQFINEIFWAALAAAQKHYKQEVCTLCVEANQVHMLLRVTDPELVASFVGYVKQETAHAINRLLGRRRKTVWVGDYDAPTILDLEKFLDMYGYCLLNPVKDKLIDSMDHYPGVSAWNMLKTKTWKRKCMRIYRNKIPRLKDPTKPWKENAKVITELKDRNKKSLYFRLNLYSWKKCFEETKHLSDVQAHALLLSAIDNFIESLPSTNTNNCKPELLEKQSMLRPYVPTKFGKKMICLASSKEIRIPFIEFAKSLFHQAREVTKAWRRGDFSLPFPPGLFPPPLLRTANILPAVALA